MTATVPSLLTAAAVRERAGMMLAAATAGRLSAFMLALDRLPAAADYVAETIRMNYPDLRVPPHARWRHFVVDGADRAAALFKAGPIGVEERARARFDLAVTSVLLDAGAGAEWRWRDPVSGRDLVRSEGLAIASLEAFRSGLFSADSARPLRADAARLKTIEPADIARIFQVSPANPLIGLDGRAALMRRLGSAVAGHPQEFGAEGRVGRLFDYLAATAVHRTLAAPAILAALLTSLGAIWQNGAAADGIALGDTWRHPAIDVAGPTRGLVPFHKLSQWLSYSLIEPLEEAGITVTDLDGLTGLAEYRNGGLFIDLGVIAPRDPALLGRALAPSDPTIVEWRALTVALLDRIAPLVRDRLGKTAAEMPLAAILEGGTWSAGRRIARERRADGGPPLAIASDGTVF